MMIGATLFMVVGLFPAFQPEPTFISQPLLWEVPVSAQNCRRPVPGLFFTEKESSKAAEAKEINQKQGPEAAVASLVREKAFELVLLRAGFKEEAVDFKGALVDYRRILNSTNMNEPRAVALDGYKRVLRQLIADGDESLYRPLVGILKDEWLNEEALDLLPLIREDSDLSEETNFFLDREEPIMALRLGRYDLAATLWSGSNARSDIQWLSQAENRRGNFTKAAELREKLALKSAAGRSRTKELTVAFDFLVKGGLYTQALELATKYPILQRCVDYNWSMGLAALAKGNDKAGAHFQAVLKQSSAKVRHRGAQYFLARSLAAAGKEAEARLAYEEAVSGSFNYYGILAQGRLEERRSANLAGPMARLLNPGPQGFDSLSLGYHAWITEKGLRLNELEQASDFLAGLGPELFKGKLAGSSAAEWVELLSKRDWVNLARLIAELKTPPQFANTRARELWPSVAATVAAEAGDYRLALRLFSRIPTEKEPPKLRGWGHPLIYATEVRQAYGDYALSPALLLALIRTESAYQPNIMSASNARGLMQILPATGSKIASALGEEDPGPLDLFAPKLNIRYGAWYLKALIDGFGDESLALAGYNGGPYNIKSQILAKKGMPLDIFVEFLPFEQTVRYVKRITESRFIYESVYLGRVTWPDLTAPVSPPNESLPSF